MRAWIFDLDGVIWRGDQPIDGGVRAAKALCARNEAVLFVTNFSYAPIASQEAKLAALGIAASGRVLSSAMAAASLLAPGEPVYVIGGPGLIEAVAAAGADIVGADAARTVIVGYDPAFDYAKLTAACRALWRGARFVATNDDRTYPGADGLLPGCGALVAAIAAATGRAPEVAGKPHGPMTALARSRVGGAREGVVFGDRADTDGAFAAALGYRFALVLSGVSTAEVAGELDPRPAIVAADAAAALAALERPEPDEPAKTDEIPRSGLTGHVR